MDALAAPMPDDYRMLEHDIRLESWPAGRPGLSTVQIALDPSALAEWLVEAHDRADQSTSKVPPIRQ